MTFARDLLSKKIINMVENLFLSIYFNRMQRKLNQIDGNKAHLQLLKINSHHFDTMKVAF